jgi:hypothetical protein
MSNIEANNLDQAIRWVPVLPSAALSALCVAVESPGHADRAGGAKSTARFSRPHHIPHPFRTNFTAPSFSHSRRRTLHWRMRENT